MFGSPVPEFHPNDDDATFALSTLDMCIDAVQRCVDAGLFVGDAADMAHQMWAVIHGVTSLELRGMLGSPDAATEYLRSLQTAVTDGFRRPR